MSVMGVARAPLGAIVAAGLVACSESPTEQRAETLAAARVFDFLERTLDGQPAVFVATYDADLGYPVAVELDDDRQVADDELWFEVTALRPVTR